MVMQSIIKPRTSLAPENVVGETYNLRPRKRTYNDTCMPGRTWGQSRPKQGCIGTDPFTEHITTRATENEMEVFNAKVIKKSDS